MTRGKSRTYCGRGPLLDVLLQISLSEVVHDRVNEKCCALFLMGMLKHEIMAGLEVIFVMIQFANFAI